MTELKKLDMKSVDVTSENIERIGSLFPNCITESQDENGNLKKAINFEVLQQLLSKDLVEGKERYEFTWPGKKKAILDANVSITKTLRPCVEESKDWENTKNLYIEGDNLEALKLLQKSYFGKVKMIYIDPPYNTGNDFIYEDDFSVSSDEYNDEIGQQDDDGNRLFKKNSDSDGRFHSKWCSMMYSRLLLARNLLASDGAIFISIDDHELPNLLKICNEIFGSDNYVGEIVRKTKSMTADNGCGFNLQHENLLIYAKDISNLKLVGELKDFDNYSNPDEDPNGDWCSGDPSAKSGGPSTYFEIVNPFTNRVDLPPIGRYWAFSKESFNKYVSKGKIKFKENYKLGERGFIFKRYKNEASSLYSPVHSLFGVENLFMNQSATIELKNLFNNDVFSYPKPVSFLERIIKYTTKENDLILDFFSGSSTTAHAVMQLNKEENINRKFIMIQLPEKNDEKSEAFKAGYKNISEIGKERIRRASKKISEEKTDSKFDGGFRVLKLASSNMKNVYYNPKDLNLDLLATLETNIKADRTDLDLLFASILIACFADNISEDVITYIAKRHPTKAVFKDSSFESSPSKINLFEIFKMYANISDDKELQELVRVI